MAASASAASFRDKGFFPSLLPPPSSFLPYAAPVGVGERGAPRPRPACRRPTPTRNWSAKRLCKSGRLTASRTSSCPRTRPRARALARPLSHRRRSKEPLRASQHGAAFCLHLNRPVRPARRHRRRRRLACPSPSRRGRPEILKSRNQFSIINHIFCQTAEADRPRRGKEFRPVRATARARWIWPARRRRRPL